ncbi:hypothetical protein PIB30_065872 [Stylosanthes scabra]|uniref:Uncharacterized protein n=1 Tax=Stylosanthes scabra TaxID=79078 RepID=A0ABU6SNE7_9FABA|nr:hypothetical protein [Stylosanthes scabra]
MAQIMSFQTLRMQRTVGLAWKHTLRSSQSTAAPLPYSAKTVAASPSLRNFLKYTFIAVITGSTVLISYGSYAYSLDEIEEKTKAFRESAKQTTIGNVDSVLSKGLRMAYSTTIPDFYGAIHGQTTS